MRVECSNTLENFNFDYEYEDSLVFVSGRLWVSDNYPFKPGVPMLAYGVDAPYGMKITGHRVEIPDTVLVCKGWKIARNPGPVMIGRGPKYWETNKDTSPKKWLFPYEGLDSIYPAEKVICDSGGFNFYPFAYDPETKELTFTPSLIVEMTLEPLSDEEMAGYALRKPGPGEIQSDVIIYSGNNDYKMRTYKLDENYDFEEKEFEDPVDYIIITHEWWAQFYEPLIKWKTQKGLRCAIKTLEDIGNEYEGATLPEKIKRYIHDMYTNHGASYILLGGDVPAVS